MSQPLEVRLVVRQSLNLDLLSAYFEIFTGGDDIEMLIVPERGMEGRTIPEKLAAACGNSVVISRSNVVVICDYGYETAYETGQWILQKIADEEAIGDYPLVILTGGFDVPQGYPEDVCIDTEAGIREEKMVAIPDAAELHQVMVDRGWTPGVRTT